MENLEEIRREVKTNIDDLKQNQQLTYVEACMQFARHTYFLEDLVHRYEVMATCFVDYYTQLAYKRNCGLYQQVLIPMQNNHDYNRLKNLKEMQEIVEFWKADPGCFVSAIDTCYQLQHGIVNLELQQSLNTYDQMYLERIVGSIPKGIGYQKRKDEQHGKCTL